MKAVIYARVSSREQEDSGYSLPAQEKLLNEYAEKRGFSIAKVFSISESASGRKQREAFNQMVDYVNKQNLKIIICEKADRLTRNFKDMVMIDEWVEKDEERQIHLVKDALILHKNSRSQEKLNWGIRMLFAKNYIDNLSEEVKKGQKEKIAQGGMPHRPRLGYMSLNENGRISHVPDPDKVPYIKRLFELFSSGNYSILRLVEAMYDEGLRSRSNKKVVKSRMGDILNDPIYIGQMRWCGKIYPGKHQPIISNELFERCQQILKGHTTPKYSKHFYQFQGLVRCVECGGLITWEKQKGILYGHCNRDYRKCSKKAWAHESEIEKKVADRLATLQILKPRLGDWIHKALKESHQDETSYHSSSLQELQDNQKRIQHRLDTLYDDRLDGKIDEQFYQKKFAQYSAEKETITNSIAGHSKASDKYHELGSTLFALSQQAAGLYQQTKVIERKRQILSLVFDKMTLQGKDLTLELSKPFALLAEAVSVTNSVEEVQDLKTSQYIFEPLKQTKKQAFEPVSSIWRTERDSNPRPLP